MIALKTAPQKELSKKVYLLLDEDELTIKGDEWYAHGSSVWVPVASFGVKVSEYGVVRRKVEIQTLNL